MSALPSKVVVITGSNRGLGAEFVNQFLFTPTPPHVLLTEEHFSHNDYIVVGCSRNIDQAQVAEINTKLAQFNAENKSSRRFVPFQLDVLNLDHIKGLVEMISTQLNGRIDILVSNAGVNQAEENTVTSLVDFDSDLSHLFHVNATSHVILTNHIAPLLLEAAKTVAVAHGTELPEHVPLDLSKALSSAFSATKPDTQTQQYAQCVYISSIMGSIGATALSFVPTYRATKAALNMYVRALSSDYPHFNFLPLHPGWVATDMGSRGGRSPPVQPPQSISGMLKVMSTHSLQEDSGRALLDFDNAELPW